ncbi:MAG TPA: hypothetical protein VGU46_03725 [Acidobacteriaceae bacterium]|nr:hypothetical protein [Acidobacteriaceae bacterium]
MKLFHYISAFFLLLPSAAFAQGAVSHPAPVGSVTESMVYVFNDAQYGHNLSMFGWSVVPEVNLTKHLGFQGDFVSLYVRSVYPGQTRFIAAAGPRFNFAPRSKFTPFVFAEGGEMRLSRQRTLAKDWNPVVKGGFGFEHRVSDRFALTLVPGEYLGQYQDDGSWNHSFTARAGLTFNLLGHRSSM